MHNDAFAGSPEVRFVQEFALCKQLEQSNALATGQCRLLFYSECKEIAMHHFFWDTLYLLLATYELV